MLMILFRLRFFTSISLDWNHPPPSLQVVCGSLVCVLFILQRAKSDASCMCPPTSRHASMTETAALSGRRVARGQSDPLVVLPNACNAGCIAQGIVVLAYRYQPLSPPMIAAFVDGMKEVSAVHGRELTGKVRVATEGVNVTLAGARTIVEEVCGRIEQWLGVDVSNPADAIDFKPQPGCRHLFSELSVRRVTEVGSFIFVLFSFAHIYIYIYIYTYIFYYFIQFLCVCNHVCVRVRVHVHHV